nr:MAG TPA: Transcription factor S-II (TFIIS) [Caudoviricetes sp.]
MLLLLIQGIIRYIFFTPISDNMGKHKSNKLRYKCMDCGYAWHD